MCNACCGFLSADVQAPGSVGDGTKPLASFSCGSCTGTEGQGARWVAAGRARFGLSFAGARFSRWLGSRPARAYLRVTRALELWPGLAGLAACHLRQERLDAELLREMGEQQLAPNLEPFPTLTLIRAASEVRGFEGRSGHGRTPGMQLMSIARAKGAVVWLLQASEVSGLTEVEEHVAKSPIGSELFLAAAAAAVAVRCSRASKPLAKRRRTSRIHL